MRRRPIIYLATTLLVVVTIKLAYIASQIESDQRYLLNKWTVVGVSGIFALAFYWKPFILRWLVALYFIFAAVISIRPLIQSSFEVYTMLNLLVVILYIYAGAKLFMLKREEEKKESNQ